MKKSLLAFAVLAFAGNVMAQSAAGGPDSFGYTFKDSNEPGGPGYSWIELNPALGGGGTVVPNVNQDDDYEPNVSLGFTFPFYGNNFTQISVATNGTVYFEDVYLGLTNECMPGTPGYTMTDYRFIAHMWNDLDPSSQGNIWMQSFSTYFVLQFDDIVPCCSAGDGDTWQLILYSSGNIRMQYKELSNTDNFGDATVGIQNDPTTGLQYMCDNAPNALASNLAILFVHPNAASVQEDASNLVNVFPNPTNGIITVDATAISGLFQFEVVNQLGQVVHTATMNGSSTSTVDLSGLSAGIYHVKLQNESMFASKKIVLQN
ncbi:MAG: T9SS type A sorting domain-containing protein [Flavobacteriales bacterium]